MRSIKAAKAMEAQEKAQTGAPAEPRISVSGNDLDEAAVEDLATAYPSMDL